MMIEVLKSKLHCVKVTEANLHYMGSITIDEDLMDAAGMIAGEKVQIVDNNKESAWRPISSRVRGAQDASVSTEPPHVRCRWETRSSSSRMR